MKPPAIDFEIEEIVDGIICRPIGDVDLRRATWLRDRLMAKLAQHPSRLVLDLADVDHIDSPVIAVLITILQAARERSCQFILCNLQDRVRSLLEITKLHRGAFTITDTLDEAVSLDNRRKFQRYRPGDLACDAGELVDVSASGVRVLCRRRPRGRAPIKLHDGPRTLCLECEVAWTRRLGFRRHEVGLRFVNLTVETARELAEIMRTVSARRLRAA